MFLKNKCQKIQEKLWDYASNSLQPEENAQVAAHLLDCQSCRKEAKAYMATLHALKLSSQTPLPESQTNFEQLLTMLPQPNNVPQTVLRQPKRSLQWRGLAMAASALGLWFVLRPAETVNTTLPRNPDLPSHVAMLSPTRETSTIPFDSRKEPIWIPPDPVSEPISRVEPIELDKPRRSKVVVFQVQPRITAPMPETKALSEKLPIDYSKADGGQIRERQAQVEYVLPPQVIDPPSGMPREDIIGKISNEVSVPAFSEGSHEEAKRW